jgi:hypothetical protein
VLSNNGGQFIREGQMVASVRQFGTGPKSLPIASTIGVDIPLPTPEATEVMLANADKAPGDMPTHEGETAALLAKMALKMALKDGAAS